MSPLSIRQFTPEQKEELGLNQTQKKEHNNCPPHHKYSSPLFNENKISKWLHTHPHSVHFDKGQPLPHHRLMNKWVKSIQKKQLRVSVDFEPYN